MFAGVIVSSLVEAKLDLALALPGQGLALSLLVALVIIYDEPYKGETAVTPDAISHVIKQSEARQL